MIGRISKFLGRFLCLNQTISLAHEQILKVKGQGLTKGQLDTVLLVMAVACPWIEGFQN